MKGNKGEWTEIYTFLKLLGEGELYSADENLEKIEDIYYPILKIFREADNRNYELNDVVKIINSDSKEVIKEISISNFLEQSEILLEKIKKASGSSFGFPEIERYMKSIDCNTLKSKSGNKRDITIKIHDKFTNSNPKLGFSIKSKLGQNSTLFNASKRTNFLYKLKGCSFSEKEIKEINSIKYKKDKIKRIEQNCEIIYYDMCDERFKSNLQVIDSRLPEIMANMVFKYYKTSGLTRINDLTAELKNENPCGYVSEDHNFYEYKIKNFLIDAALGMTSASIWDGEFDATGGYIVVKEDGEILCYHLYNYNKFKSYLYNNTRLEASSTNKYDYADIFKKEDEFFIKFNLQVRFTD